MSQRKIILASSSPRRKKLLKSIIQEHFTIITSEYEEDHTIIKDPIELVKHHSRMKALDVAKKAGSDSIIISADTLGAIDGELLTKPHTEEKAREYLKKESNRTIDVITAITLIDTTTKKELTDYEITKVRFKKLSDITIENYIKTGEPLDKGGGFAIQGKGKELIASIEGDYNNVVGLPTEKLKSMLEKIQS